MSKFVLTAQLQLKAPKNVGQVVSQIQKQLQGVQVDVQAKGAAKASSSIKQLSGNLKDASKHSKNLGKDFAVSIKRFSALAIATRSVSLFTNTLGAAIKESIEFERELIKISQVTGKTVTQLKFLTQTVTQLATGLGVSSSSLLNTSRMLSQAGFSAKETEIALKTLAKTELAPTFENITATTEGAIAIFNQFQQGAAALEAQLSSINAVAGQFAVEAGDLISVIRRTGGVFKAAGGDLNELIALFTSVRSTTRESAESISTGLRTIFTRIQRPKTIEFLKQYGIELTDLEGKFVGPYEATRRLSQALAGLEQGDLTFIEIAEELGGFRQIGKVIPLLQQFKVSQEALKVAMEGTGSLTDDAAKAQAALANRIMKVKEEFLALIRSISETQTFQFMANTALNLAEALINVGKALKPLLPLLAAFAAVKVGKGVLGMMGSLAGGKARGFNRGGPVPGVGHTDTVPAMLTPGEFVIRKESAKAIGMDKLSALNRHNRGGKIAEVDNQYAHDGDSWKVNYVPTDDPVTGVTTRAIGYDAYELKKGRKWERELGVAAKEMAQAHYAAGKSDQFLKTFQGEAVAGKYSIGGRPTHEVDKSLINSMVEAGVANRVQGRGNNATGTAKVPTKAQRATLLKRGYEVNAQGQLVKAGSTDLGKATKKAKRSNRGGPAGNDTVPAMLTPGEFVVNQKSAQRIGYGNLHRMNAHGYNKGGSVHPRGPKRMFFGGLFGGGMPDMGGGGGEAASIDVEGVQAALEALEKTGRQTAMLFTDLAQTINEVTRANINQLTVVGKITQAEANAAHATLSNNQAKIQETRSALEAAAAEKDLADSAEEAADKLDDIDDTTNKVEGKMSKFGGIFSKVGGTALIAASSLNAMLPPIDESSSTFQKIVNSGLMYVGSIGAAVAALGTFASSLEGTAVGNMIADVFDGVKPSEMFGDLFSGGRKTPGGGRTVSRGTAKAFNKAAGYTRQFGSKLQTMGKSIPKVGKYLGKFGNVLTRVGGKSLFKFASMATRAASVIGAVSVGLELLKMGLDAFTGYDAKLKKAIEEGNVEEAGDIATKKATLDQGFSVASGAAMGAAIGSFIPVIGTLGGAVIGASIAFLTLDKNTVAVARAQAAHVKATKALEKSAKEAADAMKEFEAGNMSASEALASTADTAGAAIMQERKEVAAANKGAEGQKAGLLEGFLRGTARVGTLGLAGYMGLESGAQKNARLDKEIADRNKGSKENMEKFVQQMKPATDAFSRRIAATGGSFEDFQKGLKEANPAVYQYYLENGFTDLERAFENQAKEAKKAADAFKAMNLGLNSVAGTAQAAALGMNNYLAAQEMGAIKTERTLATLEAATSKAAIGMSDAQFEGALDDAESTLRRFGANDDQIGKMRKNLESVNAAQANMPAILEGARTSLMDDLKAGRGGGSVESRREAVSAAVEKQLVASGITDEGTLKQFRDQFAGKNLSEDQLDAIAKGDMTVLEDIIGEIGEDAFKQFKEVAEAAIAAEKALISVIQKRHQAEANLTAAQQKALDVQMEVMKLQEEFGGKAVTSQDVVNNLVAKNNVGLQGLGISQMNAGDAGSIASRNAEISRELQKIQDTRVRAAQGDQAAQDAMAGAGGTEMANREERLKKLNEQNAQITRKLIDQKREEIKAIEARNKAEKDAMKSLLAGDIEAFFEQQAASAATAAAASGNQAAMNQFSASDFGRAFSNLEAAQQAGAKDMFGMQIGGAGGLLEGVAGAGLSKVGIGAAGAQAMAGTDPETTRLQSEARALAETLNQNAQTEVDVADRQLEAANIMMQAAQLEMDNAIQRGTAKMASGGMVYASTGKLIRFQPRGSDTVPAMLTPGEFVVRRSAVNRGNNLAALQAMNRGASVSASSDGVSYMNQGGQVAAGGGVGGLDAATLNSFASALNKFNTDLNNNINNLKSVELNVTLNPTAINVNLTGTSFLENLASNIKSDLLEFVGSEIQSYSVGNDGKLRKSGSTLGSTV